MGVVPRPGLLLLVLSVHVCSSFTHPFIHSFPRSLCPSTIYPFIHLCIHPLVHSFVPSFLHSFNHLLCLHLFVHAISCSFFVQPFTQPFLRHDPLIPSLLGPTSPELQRVPGCAEVVGCRADTATRLPLGNVTLGRRTQKSQGAAEPRFPLSFQMDRPRDRTSPPAHFVTNPEGPSVALGGGSLVRGGH